MGMVHGIDHVNLRAPADTIERLRRFYVDIIGLDEGPRPRFRSGSRGHWLYAGDDPVLHLSIDATGQTVPDHAGAFNHVAFACENLDAARKRLADAGIAYTTDIVEERQQVQLFLHDPVGLGVELNFISESRD